jgi:hypothetical protein
MTTRSFAWVFEQLDARQRLTIDQQQIRDRTRLDHAQRTRVTDCAAACVGSSTHVRSHLHLGQRRPLDDSADRKGLASTAFQGFNSVSTRKPKCSLPKLQKQAFRPL